MSDARLLYAPLHIQYENLHMPRLTVTVDESDKEYIESISGDGAEYDSMSEAMRNCIQAHKRQEELREEVSRLRDRLESREKRIEEVEEQLARRSNIEDKVDTLARQQQESRAPFFVEWYRWWRDRD